MAVTDGLFSGASIGEVRQLLNKERDDRIRQAQLDNFAMTQNPYAAMIAKSNQQLAEAVTGGARALGQATGLDTGMFAGLGQDARLTKAIERDALRTEVMDMAKTADLSNPEDVTKIANLLMQRGQPELATQFMAQAREAAKEGRAGRRETRDITAAETTEKLQRLNIKSKELENQRNKLQADIDNNPKSGLAAKARLEIAKIESEINKNDAYAEYYRSPPLKPGKDGVAPTKNDNEAYIRAITADETLKSKVEKHMKVVKGYWMSNDDDLRKYILEYGAEAKKLQRGTAGKDGLSPAEAIKEVLRRRGISGGKPSGGATKRRVPIRSQRRGTQ